MTISRRDFLKRAYQIGGIAALYTLGGSKLVDECLAGNYFISGHAGGGWATWDETTEAGWGDSANTFIALFENVNTGGNETGQGAGLSEANRTLTQVGNVAGAIGSPPSRVMDSTDDSFTLTSAWADALFTNGAWTIIFKLEDVEDVANMYLFSIYGNNGAAQHEQISLSHSVAKKLTLLIYQNGSVETATTANIIPTSGPLYVFAYADGTNPVRAGFSVTKPTTWAGVAANDKCELATLKGHDFAVDDFDDYGRNLFDDYNSGNELGCTAYYLVASKTSFF